MRKEGINKKFRIRAYAKACNTTYRKANKRDRYANCYVIVTKNWIKPVNEWDSVSEVKAKIYDLSKREYRETQRYKDEMEEWKAQFPETGVWYSL